MLKTLWGKKINQSSIQNARVISAVGKEGWLTFRNAVAVLAVFFCLQSSISTAATDDNITFNILQQRADTALTLFAEQANLTLVFPFEQVKEKTANRLVGNYPLKTAIDILLHDTGLTPTFSNQLVLNIAIESKGKRMNIKNSNTRKRLLASTVAFFVGGGQGVVAQEQAANEESGFVLEEVVVTATKREQRLIDVPISIEALSEEKIKDLRINSLDDLAYAVPNLTITSLDGNTNNIAIRGISNRSAGSSATVGIYLDEVPLSFNPTLQPNLQSVDVQRVEVLRGPQGTLYGQGSTGGTIRYLTNNPAFNEFEGEVTTSAYSTKDGDMSNELTAVANIPVIDDRLAFRVVAGYKDIGGWIDQPDTNKKDVNNLQASNFRIKGLWQASENLDVSAMAIRYRDDGGARNYSNIRIGNGTPFWRQVERDGLPTPSTDNESENDIYNLTLNYDFGFATLTSSSSQTNVKRLFESGSGNITQTLDVNAGSLTVGSSKKVEGFAQEVRLASTGDNNTVDWLIGAFYTDTDIEVELAGGGVYSDGVERFTFGRQYNPENTTTTALFANVGYHINDRLTLTTGVRYFEDDRDFSFEVPSRSIDVSHKESFDHVSPMISLSYALSDDANVYVSIAEGFRSGGLNVFSTEGYDPETVHTYELGAKGSLLNGRLSASGAIFHTEYDDYQATDRKIVNGMPEGGIFNPGAAEIQGLEWSTQFNLTEQFSVGFNGHYLDTEFTKISTTVNSPVNVGDPIDYTPKYSYTLNARYDFDWAFGAAGFALLDINEQDGSTSTFRVLPEPVIESDTVRLVNAQMGASWEQFSIRLFGKNLTNEDELTTPERGNQFLQYRPRTLGAEFTYNF